MNSIVNALIDQRGFINARSETRGIKFILEQIFLKIRCLKIADRYYERKTFRRIKQPFHMSFEDTQPFQKNLDLNYHRWHNRRLFRLKNKLENVMAAKKVKKSSSKQVLGKDKQTRIEILRTLADITGLPKTQIEAVFSALTDLMVAHMKKRGSGEFTIPMTGIKVRRVKKKATKPRNMVSPLTGQEVVIPGKPIRSAVKVYALKVLRNAVND